MKENELILGAGSPAEIYLAVGQALSWWEGSEDVLMGLFRTLIRRHEEILFETYVSSRRSTRSRLLLRAIEAHAVDFIGSEIADLRAHLNALDKLAKLRNEIAHGHCTHATRTVEGTKTIEGYFLLPALNEGEWIVRSFRYMHTPVTIAEFESAVRSHRTAIMDIHTAFVVRAQETRDVQDAETQALNDFIDQVASGQYPRGSVKRVARLARMLEK